MSEKLGKNPWFYIFTSPKRVVRAICNYEPKKGLFVLSTIVALHYAFLYLALKPIHLSNNLLVIVPLVLVLSPILGWVWLNFQSWALLVTGKLFKGKATKQQLLVAVAWSKLPLLITLSLWVIMIVFASRPFYHHYFSGVSLLLISFIALIAYIWSIVLYIAAIEEVQGVPVFMSLLNVFAAFMLMAIIVMSCSFSYYYLLHVFS